MRWIALVALASWAFGMSGLPHVVADEPGSVRSQFTPLALDEPRTTRAGIGSVWQTALEEVTPAPEASQPRRLAPKSDGRRPSISRPAAVSPTKTLGTVGGSLALVIGLFLVVSWCLQRGSPTHKQPLPKEAIEVLGQAPLVGRQQMQLVRVGHKVLVLALTPGGAAETLAEISEPMEVESLVAMCRRTQPGSSTASFTRTLHEMSQQRDLATSRGAR